MNKDIIRALKTERHDLLIQQRSIEQQLSKIDRMLRIADPQDEGHNQVVGAPRRTRVSTHRAGGKLSASEANELAMDAFTSNGPLNRRQLAIKLGYQTSNGTVSRVIKELLAEGLIRPAGRDSTNQDRFVAA